MYRLQWSGVFTPLIVDLCVSSYMYYVLCTLYCISGVQVLELEQSHQQVTPTIETVSDLLRVLYCTV